MHTHWIVVSYDDTCSEIFPWYIVIEGLKFLLFIINDLYKIELFDFLHLVPNMGFSHLL